jgi:hypothetical protein
VGCSSVYSTVSTHFFSALFFFFFHRVFESIVLKSGLARVGPSSTQLIRGKNRVVFIRNKGS